MLGKKAIHLLISSLFVFHFNLQSAAILQYHHVSETLPKVTSISEKDFRAHLNYLKENHIPVVPLSELLFKIKNNEPLADNTVAITFDDGYINNLTHAAPILQEFNYPYTIFVNPTLIDEGHQYLMNWQQLKQLTTQGAEIANHNSIHNYMHRIDHNESQQAWQARTQKSIELAQKRIFAMTGQNHPMLAYPYGEFNHALQAIIKELGLFGIGQHSGAVGQHTDLTRIPRFPASGIYANLNTLKTKINALPFAATMVANPIIKDNPPAMTISFQQIDFIKSQFRCYAQGQGLAKVTWVTPNTAKIIAKKGIGKGRSRYNCTAPNTSNSQRYHWLSQPWINH